MTDLVASAGGKTPSTSSNPSRATTRETRLKLHLCLLGSQNGQLLYIYPPPVYITQEMTSLSIWKAFFYFQTYLGFFHDVFPGPKTMSQGWKIPSLGQPGLPRLHVSFQAPHLQRQWLTGIGNPCCPPLQPTAAATAPPRTTLDPGPGFTGRCFRPLGGLVQSQHVHFTCCIRTSY